MKRDKKTTKSLSKISYNLLPENYDYINKELEKFNNTMNNTMNKIVDTYFDLSTESIKGLINSLEHNLNNIVKEVQIPEEVPIINQEPIIEIIKKTEVKVKKIRFNEKVD